MKIIPLLLLVVLFSGPGYGALNEDGDFQNILMIIEEELRNHNAGKCLEIIDSALFTYEYSDRKTTILNVYKVDALKMSGLSEDALSLSDTLITSKYLRDKYAVRLRIRRAAIFELLKNYMRCKEELNIVAQYYSTGKVEKDRIYGNYLYRMASYYKAVQRPKDAIHYAILANKFSKVFSYPSLTAKSSMLLETLHDKKDVREYYLSAAMAESVRDCRKDCIAEVYLKQSENHFNDGEYHLSLQYADSAMIFSSGAGFVNYNIRAFENKIKCYEKLNLLKNAFHIYKLLDSVKDMKNLDLQRIKIRNIENKYALEKKKNDEALITSDFDEGSLNEYKRISVFLLFVFTEHMVYLYFRNRQLHQYVEQKNLMFRELYHRVKNNFAVILGIIELNISETLDHVFLQKLITLRNRIESIVTVHTNFLFPDESNLVKFSSLEEYLASIINMHIDLDRRTILHSIKVDEVSLPVETVVPIGMIVNELISNTLKHAINADGLKFEIVIDKKDSFLDLVYCDNGKSFPNDIEGNMGMVIIDSLVYQLDGNYTRKGSHYRISLKI